MIVEMDKDTHLFAKLSVMVMGTEVALHIPGTHFPLIQEEVKDYKRTLADALIAQALDIMTEDIEWRDGLKPAESE